jgi:xylulokinase
MTRVPPETSVRRARKPVIGIDIGTTGTKVIVFEPDRGVVAQGTLPTALIATGAGMSEADPRQWWENLRKLIPEVLHTAGVGANEVAAIATSGMVPAVLLLDREGRVLRNAILQNDVRAAAFVERTQRALAGEDVLQNTGAAVTQQSVGPKLSWIQANEPDVWSRTATVCGSYDWILIALGAERHVEANWALESGLFRLDGSTYEPAVAAADAARMVPPRRSSGEIVGRLASGPASELGLVSGTPLVVGGADHVLSAYGAGLTKPGDWLVKLGGAGDIMVVTDEVMVDERLYLDEHPVDGLWLPNGCMATSGSLIRWFQRLTGLEDLKELDRQAALRAPAQVLTLPYFLGEKSPHHDPSLRGVIAGLRLDHDPVDIYRSVLEAIAFGFLDHVEIFQERGIALGEPAITNGGSTSVLWKQIHADVLGFPVHSLTAHPGASLAAGYIASATVSAASTADDIGAYVNRSSTYYPDQARHEQYREAHELWKGLLADTRGTMHRLARA